MSSSHHNSDPVPTGHQSESQKDFLPQENNVQQPPPEQLTYFEKQRDGLVAEITNSMELILNEVNALNRSLENSIAVGKEFDSVSSLWDSFYKSDIYNANQQDEENSKDPTTPR